MTSNDEFREVKMQPSLERTLRHKEIRVANGTLILGIHTPGFLIYRKSLSEEWK
jgi:hypothetical protein